MGTSTQTSAVGEGSCVMAVHWTLPPQLTELTFSVSLSCHHAPAHHHYYIVKFDTSASQQLWSFRPNGPDVGCHRPRVTDGGRSGKGEGEWINMKGDVTEGGR